MPSLPYRRRRTATVPYRTVAALPAQVHACTRRVPSNQQYPCIWSDYIYATSWIWLLHNKNRKTLRCTFVQPAGRPTERARAAAGGSPEKMDECLAINWHADAGRRRSPPARWARSCIAKNGWFVAVDRCDMGGRWRKRRGRRPGNSGCGTAAPLQLHVRAPPGGQLVSGPGRAALNSRVRCIPLMLCPQ
jgi:hypothetical protein